MAEEPRLNPGQVIMRGIRRCCPKCGEKTLFKRWFKTEVQCSHCGLVFEPTDGDTWGFWIIFDRVFLLAAIIICYSQIIPAQMSDAMELVIRYVVLAVIVFLLIWTMPHRMGLCIALDYLGRYFFNRENK